MSEPLPGGHVTTMVTGRVGQVCAAAVRETAANAAAAPVTCRNRRRLGFILFSSLKSLVFHRSTACLALGAFCGEGSLIRLDIARPDHLAPFLGVLCQELGILGGRERQR